MPHSQAVEYVGLCQTTLSRRLTYHAQDGGIHKHFQNYHNSKPTRDQLTENTIIIDKAPDRYRLAIKEALHIINIGPLINTQYNNFSNILKLYSHKTTTQKTEINTNIPQPRSFTQTSSTISLSQDPPTANNSQTSQSTPLLHTPKQDDDNETGNINMPDMEAILLKFGIDTSKLREVSLKKYEKEMLLIEISPDSMESPTISQRIRTMDRNARYSKIKF